MRLMRWLLFALLFGGFGMAMAQEPLTLAQAVESALRSSPALRGQAFAVERQTLEKEIARGRRLPEVGLNAGYTHHAYPTLVTPIREAGQFPPFDEDIANLGVSLRLPLYAGGRLVAGETLAGHARKAAAEGLRLSHQDLIFNVTATYTKALQLKHLGEALAQRITSLETQERQSARKVDEGTAAPLELIRVQTQLSEARHERVSVQQGEQDALTLLGVLMGTQGALPPLAEVGPLAIQVPASVEEGVAAARRNNPELLRLEAEQRAAGDRVAIARGERLPQVDLVGGAQETSGSDWNGQSDWQVGVQVGMPLYDGGVRSNRVAQAQIDQHRAREALQQATDDVVVDVRQAFGSLETARSRVALAQQREREAAEALRIETMRYQSGASTVTDLLSAESAHWAAIADRMQAEYDVTVSQVRLAKAMGELRLESLLTANTSRQTDIAQANRGRDMQ